MVWIWHVRSDKFRRDIVTRTFALIAPDWPICTEFSAVKNGRKCTQTLRNAPKHYEMQQKHEFRVPWCVSGEFLEKSSDATSWLEPLH